MEFEIACRKYGSSIFLDFGVVVMLVFIYNKEGFGAAFLYKVWQGLR